MTGWCNDRDHRHCPGTTPTLYIDEKTHRPVITGKRHCDCACHQQAGQAQR